MQIIETFLLLLYTGIASFTTQISYPLYCFITIAEANDETLQHSAVKPLKALYMFPGINTNTLHRETSQSWTHSLSHITKNEAKPE